MEMMGRGFTVCCQKNEWWIDYILQFVILYKIFIDKALYVLLS